MDRPDLPRRAETPEEADRVSVEFTVVNALEPGVYWNTKRETEITQNSRGITRTLKLPPNLTLLLVDIERFDGIDHTVVLQQHPAHGDGSYRVLVDEFLRDFEPEPDGEAIRQREMDEIYAEVAGLQDELQRGQVDPTVMAPALEEGLAKWRTEVEEKLASDNDGTSEGSSQGSASTQTRWCSSVVKIDVGRRALNNQERFLGTKTLFITGERREESSNRARYFQLERHTSDTRDGRKARHVDAWRPVLGWSEEQVWDVLQRHGVLAPVPYRLGWNRSSCMTCIFNGPRIWATIAEYFPERARRIADYEDRFGTTISRDRINVLEIAARARPFEIDDVEALEQAARAEYTLPVLANASTPWSLPAGAFGLEGCGAS